MHETTKSNVRIASLGVMAVVMAASMSAAQPTGAAQKGKPAPSPSPIPIVATFSDLSTDLSHDNVRSDGNGSPTASAYGFYAVNANGTTEGAYINSAGGIDINLVADYSARQMAFQLDEPVGNPGDACYVPAGTYVANVVDFRFNPFGSQAGILEMPLAATVSGFAAIVNFTPAPALVNVVNGVTWTVSRLTLLYRPGSIDDPAKLTFTRNEENLWTLASAARVPVQCQVSNGKRSIVYDPMDGGAFHNAQFSMTISLVK